MKKYKVLIVETEKFLVEVEADNRLEAQDAALEKIEGPDRDEYWLASEGDYEVEEL